MKLLLVEDEPFFRDGILNCLRQNATIDHVQVAVNGQQALEICKTWKPRVMLLDNHLPDIKGIQVLKEVSKLPYPAKTIAMSSDYSTEFIRRFRDIGAKGFIHKNEADAKNLNNLLAYILTKEEFWLSLQMTRMLSDEQFAVSKFAQTTTPKNFGEEKIKEYGFTEAEMKVIPYIEFGYSFQEISETIEAEENRKIEKLTVRNHINKVREKVNDVYDENLDTYAKLVAWINRFVLGEFDD